MKKLSAPTAITERESREEFLANRRLGIGGSDAAAVLGYSKRTSPLELWAQKTGQMEEEDISDLEHVEMGHELEDAIADLYARKTGRRIRRHRAQSVHPKLSFVRCHVDRFQHDFELGRGVLQIKTAGGMREAEWLEDPPIEYQMQVQHEMFVTNLRWATLAVLFGGTHLRLRWVDIVVNPAFVRVMVEKYKQFWWHVETRTPPPLSHVQADARALAALYPTDRSAEPIALPPEANQWDQARLEAEAAIKEATARKKHAENAIKSAMGDHALGVLPDGATYSWRSQTRKAYHVEEKTYRVLRRHKVK